MEESPMKRKILWGLIGLNVVLLVCLTGRLTNPEAAWGQPRGALRPSDYVMVPGEVIGGTSEVVYIVDTSNGYLGAMTYDDTHGQLLTMAPLDLSTIFRNAAGAGPNPQPGRGIH
jgi:hypothetical protein